MEKHYNADFSLLGRCVNLEHSVTIKISNRLNLSALVCPARMQARELGWILHRKTARI
jgi:hypothetical protein